MDLSRRRLSEMFLVLKAVRRIVDETHDLAARALQDAADDRARLDDWRDGEPAARAFCRRVVNERETLAREIESIRFALDNLYILPRTRNLGRKARGAKKTLP